MPAAAVGGSGAPSADSSTVSYKQRGAALVSALGYQESRRAQVCTQHSTAADWLAMVQYLQSQSMHGMKLLGCMMTHTCCQAVTYGSRSVSAANSHTFSISGWLSLSSLQLVRQSATGSGQCWKQTQTVRHCAKCSLCCELVQVSRVA